MIRDFKKKNTRSAEVRLPGILLLLLFYGVSNVVAKDLGCNPIERVYRLGSPYLASVSPLKTNKQGIYFVPIAYGKCRFRTTEGVSLDAKGYIMGIGVGDSSGTISSQIQIMRMSTSVVSPTLLYFWQS